jgi:hypothetical protein
MLERLSKMPDFIDAGRGLSGLLCLGSASLATIASVVAAPAPAPPVSKAVVEEMLVPIGGIDQWVAIRGDDSDNPVVLVLHGPRRCLESLCR